MDNEKTGISRRDFLRFAGTGLVVVGVGGGSDVLTWAQEISAFPVSRGYLIVDHKKCSGCITCMLACSLVHEGCENPSHARIQVIQHPLRPFPDDIAIYQCRQCAEPACVEACSTGALHAETRMGNVRVIDASACVGCGACVEACPFDPARLNFNAEEKRVVKCDLCASAPYWSEGGGPEGKQACIEACPMGALAFSDRLPAQEGDAGYWVNLRDGSWALLGFAMD